MCQKIVHGIASGAEQMAQFFLQPLIVPYLQHEEHVKWQFQLRQPREDCNIFMLELNLALKLPH